VLFPGWLALEEAGLGRAQVPGADKRALQSIQATAGGAGIAATVALFAQQLLWGQGDFGQMHEQQVFEVDPHPGTLAAYVGTIRAGLAAQIFHERKKAFQQMTQVPGVATAIIQATPVAF
jgi:hypothetical protein